MAKFIRDGKKSRVKDTAEEVVIAPIPEPESIAAGVVKQPDAAPLELPDNNDAAQITSMIGSVQDEVALNRMTMTFPGQVDDESSRDMPSHKDHLINEHRTRVGGKRRFLTDGLCRALNCEIYLLEVDKQWAPNPLGKGPKINIRYTREMIGVNVLFDKFTLVPKPEVLSLKQRFANENGYKYIYETPEVVLTHEVLNQQLSTQQHVKPSIIT